MLYKVIYSLTLLYLTGSIQCYYVETEDKSVESFVRLHCGYFSSCASGGPNVCGHDDRASILAYFKDRCFLHRANCKKLGTYNLVDLSVCDSRFTYTTIFEDEFKFKKLPRYTLSPIYLASSIARGKFGRGQVVTSRNVVRIASTPYVSGGVGVGPGTNGPDKVALGTTASNTITHGRGDSSNGNPGINQEDISDEYKDKTFIRIKADSKPKEKGNWFGKLVKEIGYFFNF